ncbi:hypothetical protein F3Y22_tig00110383pilonHSYRG00400 [Hibiscus syriacus]|uniref:Uncharacterized protein n=1 Tax=Hibiscus syriacus TaxID=106335 RepID=A0A6A3AVY5_HIBSY|nr:hypothetical protein F3Y22_tig00110383pilonHSYRG00400 [Hibiscus syriacus]
MDMRSGVMEKATRNRKRGKILGGLESQTVELGAKSLHRLILVPLLCFSFVQPPVGDEEVWSSKSDTVAVTLTRSIGHDILLREIEIVDDPIVVKLNQSSGYDILRCEVKIVDDSFAVKLSRSVGHDILRRELEIVDGSFVVKLSLELDILCREVEIQGLFHQIEMDASCGHNILHHEVEIVDGSFVVNLSFKLDILRCEVEIQSRVVLVLVGTITFVMKLKSWMAHLL